MRPIAMACMLACTLSLNAAAAPESGAAAAPVQTSIHFVSYGGIRDWRTDRDQGMWLQDVHRKWHYAKFLGRCPGLRFATTIGFDTHPLDTFDRFSSVFVPYGGRCAVQSVTASEGPPKKKKQTAASSVVKEGGEAF